MSPLPPSYIKYLAAFESTLRSRKSGTVYVTDVHVYVNIRDVSLLLYHADARILSIPADNRKRQTESTANKHYHIAKTILRQTSNAWTNQSIILPKPTAFSLPSQITLGLRSLLAFLHKLKGTCAHSYIRFHKPFPCQKRRPNEEQKTIQSM